MSVSGGEIDAMQPFLRVQKSLKYYMVIDMTLILCNYDLKPMHYRI